MGSLEKRLARLADGSWLHKPKGRTSAAATKQGSRRLKLPYPRDYSLRVFYGIGYNPAIDQALIKIVGRAYDSSGTFSFGWRERDLGWDFRTKRSAVAAANRIINRVVVPGGRLLARRDDPVRDVVAGIQKIHRVEVWEEAPRKILSVGFQAWGRGKP